MTCKYASKFSVFYTNVWCVTVGITDKAVSTVMFLVVCYKPMPCPHIVPDMGHCKTCEHFACHSNILIVAAVLQLASGFLYYCAALYAVGHSHFGHCHFMYLTLCFKNSLSYIFMFFCYYCANGLFISVCLLPGWKFCYRFCSLLPIDGLTTVTNYMILYYVILVPCGTV